MCDIFISPMPNIARADRQSAAPLFMRQIHNSAIFQAHNPAYGGPH